MRGRTLRGWCGAQKAQAVDVARRGRSIGCARNNADRSKCRCPWMCHWLNAYFVRGSPLTKSRGHGMAKGTSAGFFGTRRPPAVLKHEVLRQYVAPYAGMAGSTNPEGRVVFLDGYAGEGHYADGSPGSPLLALETAKSLLPKRVLECIFIEKERKSFASLQTVVEEFKAQGVRCEAVHGKVEDHLDAVVQQATGVPLFMFLDPCGLAPPYRRLVAAMTGSRVRAYPPT
jgi:hypothetical protein